MFSSYWAWGPQWSLQLLVWQDEVSPLVLLLVTLPFPPLCALEGPREGHVPLS